MPVRLEAEFVGLEKSAQLAAKRAGKNLKLNLGTSAKSIEALSQPLGRITGRADEFTKSMEAANARVLAFGASVGVLNGVTNGFKALVSTTIQVEKSLASINSILKVSTSELDKFKNQIFEVAKGTEQTFQSAAEAALELSRQGLSAVEVTQRLNDSLVLARLSGLGTGEAVAGLTAAINAFNSTGITSAEVLNKISAAAASAAVSDRDLIEGLKRSGSVAVTTGVSFDNLVGIISALQEKTARGGAVIGNSLKTIFTRISTIDKLETLENLGVQVTNLEGEVLAADKIIQNLAGTFDTLSRKEQVNLADKLVGKFQIAPFLALLQDFNAETVRSNQVAAVSFNATNEAYQRNATLNETLAALINKTTVNVQELANSLGEIGVTDSLKGVLSFFDGLITNIRNIFEGEGVGGDFARGIVKGISKVITGPGLAIFGAIIAKLTVDLAKFGVGSLQTFFGLNKAAKEQAALQGQIASSLLSNKSIQDAILAIENSSLTTEQKRLQQTEFFTTALNTQLATMKQMQSIAGSIAPGVLAGTAAVRGGRGRGAFGRGAGGFLPIGSEKSDISRGVGGAPSSAKPVVIPNFAFGGGKFGTMVANSSEYLVPNYAGGGDAIFNQNMISSMGLPANAKKIRAAGGYIPNFAKINSKGRYVLLSGQRGGFQDNSAFATIQEDGSVKYTRELLDETSQEIRVPTYGLPVKGDGKDIETFIKDLEEHSIKESIKQAKILTGGEMPTPPKQAAIRAEVNKGAVAGFAGSLFELTLAALLTDEEFLKYASLTDTSNFDLNLKGQQRLLNVYDIPGSPSFGEVKGRANNDNIKSTAAKIFRVLGQGQAAQKSKLVDKKMSKNDAIRLGLVDENFKRSSYVIKEGDLDKINRNAGNARISTRGGIVKFGAGGYIPNFSALDEAVARETSAGLPINQVRINQSGKLRNAANPMGLAVTNTRDEPRGTIPNYANGDEEKLAKGTKDATGKLIGLGIASSILSSAFTNMATEQEGIVKLFNNFGTGLTKAITTLTLFAALKPGEDTDFGALGDSISGFGGRLQDSGKKLKGGGGRLSNARGGALSFLGGGLGKLGGVVSKVGAQFGKFIPFIGPVIAGFQVLDGVLGGALSKDIKEFAVGIGQAVGIIETPALKAAKALDKLAGDAAKSFVEGGAGPDFARKEFAKLLEQAREQAATEQLKSAGVDTSEIKEGEARAALLKEGLKDVSLDRFADQLLEGVTKRMQVGQIGTQGKAGGTPIFAQIPLSGSIEEIQKVIDARQAEVERDPEMRALLRSGGFIPTTFGGQIRREPGEATQAIKAGAEGILEELREAFRGDDLKKLTRAAADFEFAGTADFAGISASMVRAQLSASALGTPEQLGEINDLLTTPGGMEQLPAKVREILDSLTGEAGEAFRALEEKILETGGTGNFVKEYKRINDLLKESTEIVEDQVQPNKILAALAKVRIAAQTDITNSLKSSLDIVKQQKEVEVGLLSTSKARRAELNSQLSTAKQQEKVFEDLAKSVSKELSDGLLGDDTGQKSEEQIAKIEKFIAKVNKEIAETNGLSGDRVKKLKEEAINLKITGSVVSDILDKTEILSDKARLQLRIDDERLKRSELIKASIDAQNKALERSLDLTESQLRRTSDLSSERERLAKAQLDSRIIGLEAQKVGTGNTTQRGIQRQINNLQIQFARDSEQRAREAALSGFRADVFARARQLNPNLARGVLPGTAGDEGSRTLQERLAGAQNRQEFEQILKDLEARQKELNKEEIEQKAKEHQIALGRLSQELSNTVLFSSATAIFAKAVTNFNEKAGPIGGFNQPELFGPAFGGGSFLPLTPVESDADKAKRELKELQDLVEKQRKAALEANRTGGSLPSLLLNLDKMFIGFEAGAIEMRNEIDRLKLAMKEAGASAVTFANLLLQEFLNLDEKLAQNLFGVATARDRGGITSGAIQALETIQLTEGPKTLGGLNAARRSTRQRELELKLAGATTFAERFNINNEFRKNEELFALRDEMNKKGISTQEQINALLLKAKQLESERLSLSQELALQLGSTQDELFKNFTKGTADAVAGFRDGLVGGITEAIQGTGSLRDALLSAVTAFNTGMLNTSLNAIFGKITGGFFQERNAGGIINGGSGVRDDVPALLTGGEFVINRKSVQKFGRGFFESLNNGSIPGFQTGGFFAPGLFGQGPITGKRDLLSFATQGFTSGRQDVLFGSGGTAAIGLEPESVRLTNRGRAMGTPLQRATRDAKSQAFGLFNQQNELEARLREEERQKKKQLRNAIIGLGASLLLGSAAAGGLASTKAGGGFFEGVFKGGAVKGESGSFGGLGNLLSGRLNRAFIAEPFKKQAMGGGVAGIDTVPTMLSAGEFVMNSAASQNIGAGNLAALNAGSSSIVTEETAEQLNQNLINKLDEVIDSSGGMGDINITINSDSGRVTQNGGEGNEANQNLARQIRDAVVNVIEQEKRLGGSLRRGLA